MKTIIFKTALLFIIPAIISCKAKNTNIQADQDTLEILNLLIQDDSGCLFEKGYSKQERPVDIINYYLKQYKYGIMNEPDSIKKANVAYRVFLADIDGLITKKELLEMKQRYDSWSDGNWQEKNILNDKIKLIDPGKNIGCKIIQRITPPLFRKDMKKAIVKIRYTKNGIGATVLAILIKKNGKWMKKGGIPIGTIG